jgi:ABC-type lipoprotein export system ATPase subunit
LCHERQLALLLATHDREAAAFADQVLELRDGRLREHDTEGLAATLTETGSGP